MLKNDSGTEIKKMKTVLSFIDEAFSQIPETDRSYKFKMQLVSEVTERANELTHRGIKDEKVIEDLIISEHPDIKGEFENVLREEKRAKRRKHFVALNALGTIIFCLVVLIAFFAHLFRVNNGLSWIILFAGVSVVSAYYTFIACNRFRKKRDILFHITTRLQLAFSVMLVFTLAFFIMLFKFNIIHSWVMFLAGAAAVLVCDALFAHFSHQRFAVFMYLAYIPLGAALLYVILAVTGAVSWQAGWLLIPLALVADAVIIAIRLIIGKKENDEVEEDSVWNAD